MGTFIKESKHDEVHLAKAMQMPMQDAWMTWLYHQHGNDGRPQERGCNVNSPHALTEERQAIW